MDLDADGAEELWIHSGVCSALVSPRRGGVIEEYTLFERGINYADVLTRRREPYHLPPSAQPGHAEANHTTDGTPSIHDIEAAARLQRLPPIDPSDRALFVDRVLGSTVTLDTYMGGAFDSVACWYHAAFRAAVEQSAHAVEVVLHPASLPAGLLEKRIRLDQAGELTVRYRWDPKAFPQDAFFCPEISVSPEVELDLTPATDVWRFPVANGVGVARQLESCLGADDLARSRRLHVLRQQKCELHGHAPMAITGGLAHDEDAADELDVLIGDARLEQLLGGHEGRCHATNVDAVSRHSN